MELYVLEALHSEKLEIHIEYALRDFIRISKPGGIVTYTINQEGFRIHGRTWEVNARWYNGNVVPKKDTLL